MTFAAIAVLYLGACAAIGLGKRRSSDVGLTAALAAGLVGVQLLLLLTK